MAEKTAILLLAHGTPDSLDEIPAYLANITGGRPMPDHVIEEIRHRYSLIEPSPLTRITMEQGRLLSKELGMPVYVGMRNWKPYIADVVAQMKADGITRIAAICLAPQNSRTSVGLYRKALYAAAGDLTVEFTAGWAEHPLLAQAFAERLAAVLAPFEAEAGHRIPENRIPVVFTAHSVPLRTVQATSEDGASPDPYADEAKATARLTAEAAGLAPEQWTFAFQSQGMSGGPWIGPTVEETLDALHQQGAKGVVIAPIGFLCDHVEILYDIDIAFKEHAAKLGIELRRPVSLNESATLTVALADVARAALTALDARKNEATSA
ncbi:ferrochelatase [Silvibacterium dinghuense]|uniref:Ferrochelatase n=1 Tax=Silvibacterium dinghuense TaxID=1560006 RepID=A0A4Q1SJA8_9BACT|nr:ferrochelatase [Silvibacterium dinghuense]RXS97350.1 ferrochelatase [Silvibacterium dinghuense]GGG98259.1 ferrochelatase [Silvibacterium dinghuense]